LQTAQRRLAPQVRDINLNLQTTSGAPLNM
jgi:hypothetical protein